MIHWLCQNLLLCPHLRTTYPFTSREGERRTYVVCLDCGQQLRYDWAEMRVVRAPVPSPDWRRWLAALRSRLPSKRLAPSPPADPVAGQQPETKHVGIARV